jgi:two-component system, chemotaxis family, protein-glutamate methylesterase/glutaminase
MSKIRVLSVDDSALMRQIMTEIINSHSDMEMVATAPDPLVARDLIKKFNPDVLTLDVEMPRMDGLDFLEKLMRLRPMPVVMVSSLTGKGSEVTLRALELGAIDFVTKPQLGIREGMLAYNEMIAEKVRTAAKASLAAHKPLSAPTTLKAGPLLSSEKLIAIGASTGGTEAIRHVLQPLPLSSPALLITQHMPPGFTRSFADRLNKLCQIGVKEAASDKRTLCLMCGSKSPKSRLFCPLLKPLNALRSGIIHAKYQPSQHNRRNERHQHHAANQRQQRQHGFSDQQNNLPEDQIRVIDNTVIKMQPSGEHARQSTGQRHTAKPDNTNAHQQNQQ